MLETTQPLSADATKPRSPAPVTVIAGFLGAGKTTLVKQMLQGQHGRRIAVVVNDFGSINIDTELISEVQEGLISLENGCVCCSIRMDLIGAVLQLAALPEQPEHIVIEASGVADPASIANTFLGSEIWDKVLFDGVITVIDAEQVLRLPDSEVPLTRAQVAGGDLLILNKTDLADATTLSDVKSWLRAVAPGIQVFETSHCQLPLEILLGTKAGDLTRTATRPVLNNHIHRITPDALNDPNAHHHEHELAFITWSYVSAIPMQFSAMQRVLAQLPSSVLRVKGFIQAIEQPEQRMVFQLVGCRATVSNGLPWGENKPQTRLVFIARAALRSSQVAALEQALNSCQVKR